MDRAARLGAGLDWKTSLQELTASLSLGVPEYDIEQTGPDHAKTFTAWAVVVGVRHGGVQGRTKKEAEQRAARAAFLALTANGQPADGADQQPVAATTSDVTTLDVTAADVASTKRVGESVGGQQLSAGESVGGRNPDA
jgi:ribonuclease-3